MPDDRAQLEQTELNLRIEKLELEIQGLRQSSSRSALAVRVLTILVSLAPLFAIFFAFEQFLAQQRSANAAVKLQNERAFMQPVLQRQMDTYFEAAGAAATIADSSNPAEQAKARETFGRLFYGPLVMLESPEVSLAMKNFGSCLGQDHARSGCNLHDLSLELASALQSDYFASWNLDPGQYAARSINYVNIRKGESSQPSKTQ
jgi:hypothetical protein